MKILMYINKEALESKGGDLVQMAETKKSLERIGYSVDISYNYFEDLSKYDIVHIFNTTIAEELYLFYKNSKKQKKPIVVSTIYWNRDKYIINNPGLKVLFFRKILGKKLSLLVMKNRRLFSRNHRKQKKVLAGVDYLITTSKKEQELLLKDFKLKNKNFANIPCGVNRKVFFKRDDGEFKSKFRVNDYFLCVGRIEDLKNQLKLINFFKKTEYNLVLIGGKNNKQEEYWRKCKEASRGSKNIILINHLNQDVLASAYSGCIAHISPSWFESFGLVTLEAIFCGANVVSTENSPMKEYFKNKIHYCDPAKIEINLGVIVDSFMKGETQGIQREELKKFNWDDVAKEIDRVYKKIFEKNNENISSNS